MVRQLRRSQRAGLLRRVLGRLFQRRASELKVKRARTHAQEAGATEEFVRDAVHHAVVVFPVERRQIWGRDLQTPQALVDFWQSAILEHKHTPCTELTVSGYDTDKRSLWEIPEVRVWIGDAQRRFPFLPFMLMEPGLTWYLLSLLGPPRSEGDAFAVRAGEVEHLVNSVLDAAARHLGPVMREAEWERSRSDFADRVGRVVTVRGEYALFSSTVPEEAAPVPEAGVGALFDIDDLNELGHASYGEAAFAIVLGTLDPARLLHCMLMSGDTDDSQPGRRRPYSWCIGIETDSIEQVDYFKKTLASSRRRGLLPPERRVVAGRIRERYGMIYDGFVDMRARLQLSDTGALWLWKVAANCGWKCLPTDDWLGRCAADYLLRTYPAGSQFVLPWSKELTNIVRSGLLEAGRTMTLGRFQQFLDSQEDEQLKAVLEAGRATLERVWQ